MSHLLINNPIIPKSRSIPTSRGSTLSICPIAFMPIQHPPRRIIVPSTFHGRNTIIECMANPRRVKMVAKQIRRELSDMLLTDKVLQYAVLPEAALGADRYLSSLTTISDVEVSADLQGDQILVIESVLGKKPKSPSHIIRPLVHGICVLLCEVVKVYVSVFGDERGKEVALAGLKAKAKYVRSKLGKRMKLRLTPEIRFIEDESLERGSRVLAILDNIKDENDRKATGGQAEDLQDSSGLSDDEWEGNDPDDDEGIIYVE